MLRNGGQCFSLENVCQQANANEPRERGKQTDRDRQTETDKERDRQGKTHREGQTDRQGKTETETDRERLRETDRQRRIKDIILGYLETVVSAFLLRMSVNMLIMQTCRQSSP